MTALIKNQKIERFNQEQYELLRNSICKGASDTEIAFFVEISTSLNLDPFLKEVYFFKQGNAPIIGIGINGYRKIAERTGRYSPGKSNEYGFNKDGRCISATAYVKKQTMDGTWHEVSATCFMDEFPKAAKSLMPMHKLGVNAESHALRKAFPDALNGTYTKEELETTEGIEEIKNSTKTIDMPEGLTEEQCANLDLIICESQLAKERADKICKFLKVETIYEIPQNQYLRTIKALHEAKGKANE